MRTPTEFKLRKVEMPITIFGVGKWNATIYARILSIGNDGIGAYECHGFRGYDSGSDYVDDFEIELILLNGKRPDNILYKRVEKLLYTIVEGAEEEDKQAEELMNALMQFEEDELYAGYVDEFEHEEEYPNVFQKTYGKPGEDIFTLKAGESKTVAIQIPDRV